MAAARRPTLPDVAREAGVSPATVSRVLNGKAYVKDSKRQAVTEAMARLGYRPNQIAQSLRTQRTMTVGFAVPNFTNEIYASLAEGASQVMEPAGRTLLVSTVGVDGHRQLAVLRDLVHRGVEGLILSLADETADDVVELLTGLDIPVVLVDRDMPAVTDADRVLVDHSAVAEAAKELRGLGHERVLLIAPLSQIRPGREAAAAFRAVFPEGQIEHVPLTHDVGVKVMSAALAAAPAQRPTGLIVSGTNVLVGVLTVVRQRGLRMPQDISLVGYDESAVSHLSEPEIDTISRDTVGMGVAAARLLLERLDDGRDEPATTEISTRYLRAASVGRAPARPRPD